MYLFFVVRVHKDGDGAIVEECHLHISTEFSRAYWVVETFVELVDEILVEGFGVFRTRCADVARAVAFLCGGHKGELAHHQHFSIYVYY